MISADPKMKRVRKGVYACAQCGEELNEVTVKNDDPFCSTSCCHTYHGVEIQLPGRGYTVASSS
jgi:predicted nucleic acid-binding Zn ribbon protein